MSTQRVDNPMFYFQQKKREKRNRKDNDMAVARYTLAVNRRYKRDGEQEADFISCITFGKSAEFAQKYLRKGIRIVIGGRISTGSYKDTSGVPKTGNDCREDRMFHCDDRTSE